MDNTTVVVALVGVILGGGGVGAIVPLLRFRADRDSTIAAGSEAAVQSLTTALIRSDLRVTHLEAENETLRATIEKLRTDVDRAQASVIRLSADLAETRQKLDNLLGKNLGEDHVE